MSAEHSTAVMGRRSKIVHLTSVHPPFDSRIFHKECRTLRDRGFDVTLVVPTETDALDHGVQLRAVPSPTSRAERLRRTWRYVLRAAIAEEADLYHFHDSELLVVGLLLRLRGRRVVYDVHEDLPRQVQGKGWIPKRLRSLVAGIATAAEWAAGLAMSGIVGATPTISRRFPKRKTATVQNYPVLEEWATCGAVPYPERPPVVVYVGGITLERGASEMIEAVGKVPHWPNVRLQLAGNFTPAAVEARLRALPAWRNVDFLGWQTREGVAELLARARVGLVLLHPRRAYQESYPIKLFEYMAAGLPVVVSDFPLWREIVTDAECGLVVNPLDADAIATAIAWLLDHPDEAAAMGERGHRAVVTRYNWGKEAEKLVNLYERLLY